MAQGENESGFVAVFPDSGFVKADGKLYWRATDGSLIGPLDPSAPTCGDNYDGEVV